MSNLESAYQSLATAKGKREKLITKKKKLEEIYNILTPYCRGYGEQYNGNKCLNEIIAKLKKTRRETLGLIVFAILLYTIGIGLLDLTFIAFADATEMIPISILFGLSTFLIATHKAFPETVECHKKINQLNGVIEYLNSDSQYTGKTLRRILDLLSDEEEKTEALLGEMNSAIGEYENTLGELNKDLAEEILAESGIEASVTMNSSMKVLAKRYEQ